MAPSVRAEADRLPYFLGDADRVQVAVAVIELAGDALGEISDLPGQLIYTLLG